MALARGAPGGVWITSSPVGGEDLVERGDEHGGVVADQEPEPVDGECHGEVAGGLGAPGAGEITGDAGEVHAAGGVFDEEQDVELAGSDGVDDEGVTGDDPLCLAGQELGPGRPGASWGRVDAVTAAVLRRLPVPAINSVDADTLTSVVADLLDRLG